ncbi:biotin synthase BioB [Stomatohabitans albus]|uniref:biotin synthase BioB n=1 Tax=Stomatohabitans albus TaxID=3110766 RepID=UPI003AB9B873
MADLTYAQLDDMATRAINGEPVTRDEALAVLRASDAMTMPIVMAAGRIRRHFFDNRVKANFLINLKSGKCPEDCSYCSQSVNSTADVLKYSWLKPDEVVKQAKAGVAGGAQRVCLVASGRGPTDRDIDRVGKMIEGIKDLDPSVRVCTCLGLLKDGQADKLAAYGSDTYNHNLNTSPERYEEICTTHTYQDRQDTVTKAAGAGMYSCSGMIAGMGESDEELVDLAMALNRIGADSIPINFLLAFDGTVLADMENHLTPQRCLRIYSMVRFLNPSTEVRAAAGREEYLRSMQPMALEVCNSIFLGDYLTSEGAAGADDLRMIHDAGFVLEDAEGNPVPIDVDALPKQVSNHTVAPSGCGSGGGCGDCASAGSCGDAQFETELEVVFEPEPVVAEVDGCCGGHDGHAPKPASRKRGAGTEIPANA